jgi:hypothetical protein
MLNEALIANLEARLKRFEAEHAIRACMNRYMVLCDALDASTQLTELAGLFTIDAVWEGKGAKYANSFGGYRGREEIGAMFSTDGASGSWVMLQTSTFASGASHLNAARLTVRFAEENGQWRMAHFQTENLFSRPVDAWNSEAALPVPSRPSAE